MLLKSSYHYTLSETQSVRDYNNNREFKLKYLKPESGLFHSQAQSKVQIKNEVYITPKNGQLKTGMEIL